MASEQNSSVGWNASSLLSNSPKHSRRKEGDESKHRTYESKLHNSPSSNRDIAKMTFELDTARYIELLRRLIAESESLQNSPALGLYAREDNAAQHVMDHLKDYTVENGGPLIIEHLSVCEGRGNLKITYPGCQDGQIMSFVGSHMDVVPADAETWSVDPFHLTVNGDKLYGRGTTDCLGHVALLTLFMEQLAIQRPTTDHAIVCVFIASEEAESHPVPQCGVESLLENGHLAASKNGPLFWIDSADSQPCLATAGAIEWTLKCDGKIFHSGLPYKGINALEMVMEASGYLQSQFYEQFPAHPCEADYFFACASTMKPTQVSSGRNSVNQVPAWSQVTGDIRLTPFYDISAVKEAMEAVVARMNADPTIIPSRGAASKYVLNPGTDEEQKGKCTLTWGSHCLQGVACDMNSPGYHALRNGFASVMGEENVKPYSICGSLPLVREMKDAGFDIQITGFGLASVYHGTDEYCLLSDMCNAFKVVHQVCCEMEKKDKVASPFSPKKNKEVSMPVTD